MIESYRKELVNINKLLSETLDSDTTFHYLDINNESDLDFFAPQFDIDVTYKSPAEETSVIVDRLDSLHLDASSKSFLLEQAAKNVKKICFEKFETDGLFVNALVDHISAFYFEIINRVHVSITVCGPGNLLEFIESSREDGFAENLVNHIREIKKYIFIAIADNLEVIA